MDVEYLCDDCLEDMPLTYYWDWPENQAKPIAADAKSVEWVEQQTGLTFFDNLPESIKSSVKKELAPGEWGL